MSYFGIELEELNNVNKNVDIELSNIGGIEGLCARLNTSPEIGIEEDSIRTKERRATFGSNTIPSPPNKSFWRLMFETLQDPILILLTGSAAVSLGFYFYGLVKSDGDSSDNVHKWIEGASIMTSVSIIVLVTAINDYNKEKQFRCLKNKLMKDQRITVLRRKKHDQIPVDQLMVGDICLTKYGDIVPADGVVLSARDLEVNESSLTGESKLVKKIPKTLLLSGSQVQEGYGTIIITAVGKNSQVGCIMALLEENQNTKENKKSLGQDIEAQIPEGKAKNEKNKKSLSVLQVKLLHLTKIILIFGLVIAILTGAILIIRFTVQEYQVEKKPFVIKIFLEEMIDIFATFLSILVVCIPEGLPLAVTISLAYSVNKMLNDNNLVRHIYACETMGNATTICTDKTGTLTTNQMSVVQSYICEIEQIHPLLEDSLPDDIKQLLSEAISINSAYTTRIEVPKRPEDLEIQYGNKTECALLKMVWEIGYNYDEIRKIHPESQFHKVYPFNSARKSMSTVIRLPNVGYRVFIKGATEIILSNCTYAHGNKGRSEIVQIDISKYNTATQGMAKKGQRTICIAYKDYVFKKVEKNQTLVEVEPDWKEESSIMHDLTCLAVIGIADPIRAEVPDAIEKCKKAGIVVRMVTGDNVITAKTIAKRCGILTNRGNELVLDGTEFNRRIRDKNGNIQQELIDKIWPNLRVLARSSPTDKYTLVKAIIESKLSKNREVVAVTGDGTNDSPALKKADVGFAMGISGTDVAKDASDIIITDDNFASIVKAVMWGRNIYDNISKFLQFQLTANVVASIVEIVGVSAFLKPPLKAVQMLWLNLIMDTLASLALATEIPSPDLLERRPYGRKKPILSRSIFRNIIGQAIYQVTVLFILMFAGQNILGLEDGSITDPKDIQEIRFTMVFNTFFTMTFFNEINARKLHGHRNLLKGITSSYTFIIIWCVTVAIHIVMVQFGYKVLSSVPLGLWQWAISIAFGIGSLLWYQLVVSIKVKNLPKGLEYKRGDPIEDDSSEKGPIGVEDIPIPHGKVLWFRGYSKLRNTLNFINSLKPGLEDDPPPAI